MAVDQNPAGAPGLTNDKIAQLTQAAQAVQQVDKPKENA